VCAKHLKRCAARAKTPMTRREQLGLGATGIWADLGDFHRLMQAVALRIGNLLYQSELGREAGPRPTMKDARGLRAFLEEYPRTARGVIVLHGGDESYWLDEKILAVPWWRVM
jgi:hypothetical protein